MAVFSDSQLVDAGVISLVALGLNLPITYQLTNKLLKGKTASPSGVPSLLGVAIHSAVLFVFLLIYFKSLKGELKQAANFASAIQQ